MTNTLEDIRRLPVLLTCPPETGPVEMLELDWLERGHFYG